MIHFLYELPSNPTKTKKRTFFREAEMRAYIQALQICYGERALSYSWGWTTLEAERTNGFDT